MLPSNTFINAMFVTVAVMQSFLLLLSADRVDSSSSEDIATASGGSTDLSNGWGQSFAWQESLDTALSQASQQWKPLMLIIHKSWCGACKNLKAEFSTDDEILELSDNFVMLNLGDDKEPSNELFKPDGAYIPRILFLHPDGSLLRDVINKDGNPKFKYFYASTDDVFDSMEDVLDLAESWTNPVKDEL